MQMWGTAIYPETEKRWAPQKIWTLSWVSGWVCPFNIPTWKAKKTHANTSTYLGSISRTLRKCVWVQFVWFYSQVYTFSKTAVKKTTQIPTATYFKQLNTIVTSVNWCSTHFWRLLFTIDREYHKWSSSLSPCVESRWRYWLISLCPGEASGGLGVKCNLEYEKLNCSMLPGTFCSQLDLIDSPLTPHAQIHSHTHTRKPCSLLKQIVHKVQNKNIAIILVISKSVISFSCNVKGSFHTPLFWHTFPAQSYHVRQK